MKLLIVAFALLALTQAYPQQQDGKLHIPEKCSDVLAVKVCDRLDRMAKSLKLKSEEVKKAVVEAYLKGKTKSEEIYKSAEEFLKQKVLTKKCEDLTTVENCQKLRKMAADLKVQADKVAEFVMKEVANLKTKECEDFLDSKQCGKLKEVAGKLKIRFEKLQDMLVDAYLEAKAKGTDMVKETYTKVKNYVKATKCEDMFNPNLCKSFRKYAEKTKVALPQIIETAYNLVLKGVSVGKDLAKKVYDIVDYMYDCTDIFDKSSCDRMSKWAASLKVTAQEFEKAVKKYVRIAIEKSTSIYQTIKKFVKDKIYCRFSKKCSNPEDADEVQQDDIAFGIFGDFKDKVKERLNKKFPNLEDALRAKFMSILQKANSMFDFLKKLGAEIRQNAAGKWREFLSKFVVENYLY